MASQALPSNYHKVESPEDLQAKLSAALDKVSVLYFRTDWAEPCKTMDGVMLELAKRYEAVLFLSVRRGPSLADDAMRLTKPGSRARTGFRLRQSHCQIFQSLSRSTPSRTDRKSVV